MAEIRIRDVDESTSKEEILEKIASIGLCKKDNIRAGELVQATNGLSTLWVRCPLMAAKKITRDKGRLDIH